MNKPKKHAIYAYNWNELERWVKHKTGRDVRDWAGKFSGQREHDKDSPPPYQDMWHWIIARHEIHNGCYFDLCLDDSQCQYPELVGDRAFVREILAILREDFGNDWIKVYAWW